MGVNLDISQAAPEQQPIGLDETNATGPVPDNVAVARTRRAYMGLNKVVPDSFEDMYNQISSGAEQQFRARAATAQDNQNAQKSRQDAIGMLSGGLVNNPEDVGRFLQATTYDKVNPQSVIEQNYGKAAMNSLNLTQDTMGGSYKQAFQMFPKFMDNSEKYGAESIAKHEYARTLYENNRTDLDNESWSEWGWSTLKHLLPGYDDAVIRSLDTGDFLAGGPGIGSHMDVITRNYLTKPFDEYKKLVDDTFAKIKDHDPQTAQRFLRALMGSSTSDIIADNLGSALDQTFIAGGLAPFGKAGGKVLNVLKSASQGVRDVAKEAMRPDSSPGSIANAAGDAERATNHMMASNLMQEAKGSLDQTKAILEQVTSNFKSYDEQMRQNAGRMGQEGVNRFIERRQQLEEAFFKFFGGIMRVDRMPELDTEMGLQAFKEGFKKDFKTPADAIVDAKMHLEPFTNTRWGELQMIRPDGKAFETVEGAKNWADQHGITIRVPEQFERDLDQRLADLEQELRNPPQLDADTAGLNSYHAKEQEYEKLKAQKNEFRFKDRGDTWTIKPQGQSYYMSLLKPIDESAPWVRNLMGGPPQTDFYKIFNPKSWFKTQIGRFRTSEELISNAENQERKVATHGPTQLTYMMAELSDAIDKVATRNWNEFRQTIEHSRKMLDANGEPGYWFKNPGEMDDYYVHNFNRTPTEAETNAYFTYVRNYEVKRIIESSELFKYKARLGAEQHRVTFKLFGKEINSNWFDGMDQKHWPGANDDLVAFIMPNGKVEVQSTDQLISAGKYKPWKESVDKGETRVLRVFAPDEHPLKGFQNIKDERIRYVITRNAETQPLDLMNQVNRKEGGHFVYDYDYYLKKADMHEYKRRGSRIYTYRGDDTAAAIPIRAVGEKMEKNWNDLYNLIKEGKLKEAEALHAQTMPGDLDWKTFLGYFQPTRDAKGRITGGARFKLNDEPFVLVEKNKNIYDSHAERMNSLYGNKGKFVDGTTTGSDAQQYRVAFTQQRDAKGLMAIRAEGSEANPIYHYEPAALADPIDTYNRATAQLVKSSFFNDYKLNSYLHWLDEALKYNLLNKDRDQVMGAFYHYFHNVPWRSNLNSRELLIKQNLLNAYGRINDFTGLMSDVERQMFSLKSNMVDMVYGKLGAKAAIMTDKAMATTRDPTAFIRNITFHAFLGLFHIPAFFTQLSTALNVHAISPRSALASTAAALMHNWSRINANEEILTALDDKMSKLSSALVGQRGFRPGEWREAYEFIHNKTGFDKLGHEQALLDDPTGAKVLRGIKDKILDWGAIPFQEGARWTRMAAGYSAYLERRELAGPGTLSRQDWAWILDRAADLDHNMSRASNSALHTGWASLAGQFQTYALRLNELMTGKRLTPAEKIRLFTVTSIMYGIPGGGISLYLWPVGDTIRQSVETGEGFGPGGYIPNPFPRYNPGESPLSTGLMEGWPSVLVQYLTSDGKDFRSGSQVNIRKYGPEQYQVAENTMNGEGIMKTLMGPAAGELANIWAGTDPLRQWAVSVLNPKSPYFPLTVDDLLEPLKDATSTGSKLGKLYTAWHTQRLISNRGTYLSDVTLGEALTNAITGLQPTPVTDIPNKEAVLKWRDGYDKDTLGKAGREVQKALMADDEGDKEQRDKYFVRARAILEARGYPEEKIAAAMAQLMKDATSLPERLDYKLNIKTDRDKAGGLENYKRILELEDIQKKARGK